MCDMKQINLRLTELTLAAIDELRGIAPRNAWIAQAVDEKIARDTPGALAVAEAGRRLASQRDDLIAAGANPADLEVPLAPISVPEPKPSKTPPSRRNTGVAGGTKGASPTPVEQPVRKTAPPTVLDHSWVGIGDRCLRVDCPAPKDRARHPEDPPY